MDDNYWLLAQKAEIAALEAEVQGMMALNQYRTSRGEVIGYDHAAFQEKADELRNIAACIMEYSRRF